MTDRGNNDVALIISAVATLLLTLSGCAPDASDLHIVQEVRSPDGALAAAYVEDTGGGAVVGTGFDVYVFSGSSPTSYADRVFHAECVEDVHVSWPSPKVLRIAYGASVDHMVSPVPGGPWWTFGKVRHGLRIQLAPRPIKMAYC